MVPAIVPIVEGHAEQESVAVLVRRGLERLGALHVQVSRPFRLPKSRMERQGELPRAIQLASADRPGAQALLVLCDADDDCPVTLARLLRDHAKGATDKPVCVVVAERELEAWFLGAKRSLRGVRGIRSDAESHAAPQSVRGAKERLSSNMAAGRRYLEVDDQPALAAKVDFEEARQACSSFDKFLRDVEELIVTMGGADR
jgi:hypothetical protein